MSQRSVHATSIYTTYNQSSNVQPSRNSAYTPVTNHYDQPRIAKSLSPAEIDPEDIDLNHPANWGVFDDPTQPPRKPRWERKSSAMTQSYPVRNYDSSRQTTPTVSGQPVPHSSYQSTFDKHASSLYEGASVQASPYSSTSPLRLPQQSYTYTNTVPATTQPSGQGSPYPYASSTRTYPPRSAAPTSVPPQGISRHATPSRSPSSALSRPPIPSEWHQPASQASHMEAAADEPCDKERHKSKKASRHSMLDGIPRDQMKRFRIVDLATGPSSSSGSKRTRSPGSDVLPDAKVRATVQGDTDSGPKGKAKADQSFEDEQLVEKRRKEADRLKRYRNTIDGAYDELRAALYPDEEQSSSVRSDHGRRKCMQDAAKRIMTSTPNEVCRQREATLYARIGELESLNTHQGSTQVMELHARLQQSYEENAQLLRRVEALQKRLEEKERQS